jgi:Alginate export
LRPIAIVLLCLAPLSAQQSALPNSLPTDEVNRTLPPWINFSADERMRLEGFSGGGFHPGNDDLYVLNRFRLMLTLRPAPWWKIVAQTQDARVWGDNLTPAPPHQDTWDLRQAYAELGDPDKNPIALRVGRQEISLGGERLIGVSQWQNVGRSFDAARLLIHYRKLSLTALAASVAVLRDGQVGSADAGNNLHGLYGSIVNWIPNSTVEPYFMWRLQPNVRSELGPAGHLDMKVSGARWLGKVRAFDYNTSVVIERGSMLTDQVNAWAGHWLLAYSFANLAGSPRLVAEYNYATGDGNPHDSRMNTFQLLYPTAHDRHGLSDQVGWRNIHHLRATVELKPRLKWTLTPSYNAFWLADAHDALYNSQGNVAVARVANGSAGRWVGQELDLATQYSLTRFTQIGAGFAHIFPGTFLQLATPGHGYSYPYLQISTKF